MKRAIIQPSRCRACESCEAACVCAFQTVIREEAAAKPRLDFFKCSGCARRKTICRGQAIGFVLQPCAGRGRMSW
ncbi:MAG: hypothetical protein WC381_06030 [Kiritimatiellia bacterium]